MVGTDAGERTPERPGVVMTLLLIVGVVPFMAGLFGLYTLLGVGMAYFGFLFLVYWAAILRQDPSAYLPSVLGGLSGVLLAWILIALPPQVGSAGIVISMVVLIALLFCFMRGHFLLVINNATMLFLTVATVPQLDIAANILTMVKSLMVAAIYMGVVTLLVHFVTKRRNRTKAARAAAPA